VAAQLPANVNLSTLLALAPLAAPTGGEPIESVQSGTSGAFTVNQIVAFAKASITTLAGPISIAATSAATSTTSGALQVVGGVGIGGAVHAGNSFSADAAFNVAPAFDISNGLLSVGASSNVTLGTTVGGFVVGANWNTGEIAVYLVTAAGATVVATISNNWVVSTTTPASGKMSIAYDGTQLRLYNGFTTLQQFRVFVVKFG